MRSDNCNKQMQIGIHPLEDYTNQHDNDIVTLCAMHKNLLTYWPYFRFIPSWKT